MHSSLVILEGEEIRTGTADITLCYDKNRKQNVYVKKFFNEEMYLREKRANEIVYRFNVIHMLDYDDENKELVFEDGGEDLCNYIIRTYQKNYFDTEQEVLMKFQNIFYTLLEMHKQNIVHNDIKAENIATINNNYRLLDFGHCERLKNNKKSFKKIGTIYYSAPEVYSGEGHDTKADVYALGITLYIALTKRYPFDIESYDIYRACQLEGNFDEDELVCCDISDNLINVLKEMLDPNPENRCTIQDCIKALYPEDRI